MRIRIPIIMIMAALAAFLGLSANGPGALGAETPSAPEQVLLDCINEAREAPLRVAVRLGMDPDEILAQHPDMEEILTEGLPPLAFDPKLHAAATRHNRDMLANRYYAHNSLDGLTYKDRIAAEGYHALAAGEALGMLGFRNFIEAEEAVRTMFQIMFRDELDPARTEKRNILDARLSDAGVSLLGGAFSVNGVSINVYLAVCDFGLPDTCATERTLLQLLNEARRDPLGALKEAGIDEESAKNFLGGRASLLYQGLDPLAWNEILQRTAREHAADMSQRNYFSRISPEGTGPAGRIAGAGYSAVSTGETLAAYVGEENEGPLKVARRIFRQLLLRELDPGWEGERNLFRSDVAEVGFSVHRIEKEESPEEFFLIVADFARSEAHSGRMIGTVFHDKNGNGRFDPGEGLAGLSVTIRPLGDVAEGASSTETGLLGHYQLELLAAGFMGLTVENAEGEILVEDLLFVQIEHGQSFLKNIPTNSK